MPTIVDSLVVSLGIDASNFSAGQKRMVADLRNVEAESTRTAKAMQASGKQAAEYFSAIKTEVLSLIGVFLGGKGIETFVRDTTRSLADFGRTVGQLGSNGQQVQAFELAIQRMGGSIEAAHGSLLGLAKAKQDFITLGAGAQSFQFMSIMGATPNMTPLEIMERFGAYAKRTVNLPGGESQIRQIGEGSGIDTSTILAMIQIAKTSSLEAEMRESVRLGGDASKQQIEAATKFQTSVSSFEQAADGFARALIPFDGMTAALKAVTDIMTKNVPAQKPGEFNPAMKSGFVGDWLKDQMNPSAMQSGEFNPAFRSGFMGDWASSLWDRLKNAWTNYRDEGRNLHGPGPRASLGGNEARESLAFWTGKGLTNAQAAGMAAQEMAESGGSAGARGDWVNGVATAHGAYQWHADRRARILAGTGIDVSTASIAQQREAAYWELTHTEAEAYRRLLAAGTPEQAGAAATEFERPDPNRRAIIDIERGRDAALIARLRGPGKGPIFGPQSLPDPALSPRRMLKREDMMAPSPGAVSTTSVNVNTVNVHAPGGDPHTIAREFNRALTDEVNAQSNRGLR